MPSDVEDPCSRRGGPTAEAGGPTSRAGGGSLESQNHELSSRGEHPWRALHRYMDSSGAVVSRGREESCQGAEFPSPASAVRPWYDCSVQGERAPRIIKSSRAGHVAREPATMDERIEAVWELTLACMAWRDEEPGEPRLRRTVVRIRRP